MVDRRWDQWYSALVGGRFVEVDGGVFHVSRNARQPKGRSTIDCRPIRHMENEANHQHFDLPLARDRFDRWRANLCLARSLELMWREQLRRQFAAKDFVLFTVSELHTIVGGGVDMANTRIVLPTVRLWSADASSKDVLLETYRVAELSDDVALDVDGGLRLVKVLSVL